MKKREYVWCICHIDNKLYGSIEAELKKAKYDDIKVYIPTLSILKKRSKGKDIYEDVPMLFSYGFIRMRKSILKGIPTSIKKGDPGNPFLGKVSRDNAPKENKGQGSKCRRLG